MSCANCFELKTKYLLLFSLISSFSLYLPRSSPHTFASPTAEISLSFYHQKHPLATLKHSFSLKQLSFSLSSKTCGSQAFNLYQQQVLDFLAKPATTSRTHHPHFTLRDILCSFPQLI